MTSWSTRPATADDSQTIQSIERRAGEQFRDVGLPEVADDSPEPIDVLERFATGGGSIVAYDEAHRVVGYVLIEEIDETAFVHQVSVLPEQQNRGVGRRLLSAVDAWATARGITSISLTTFDRHVPWNRPLYEHLGFRVLLTQEIGAGLRAIQAAEAAKGLQRRVAMTRPVRPLA